VSAAQNHTAYLILVGVKTETGDEAWLEAHELFAYSAEAALRAYQAEKEVTRGQRFAVVPVRSWRTATARVESITQTNFAFGEEPAEKGAQE